MTAIKYGDSTKMEHDGGKVVPVSFDAKMIQGGSSTTKNRRIIYHEDQRPFCLIIF